jgi:phosphate transport system substrate-binding protein
MRVPSLPNPRRVSTNSWGVKEMKQLPVYKSVFGILGNLNSVGSDTLNILMTLWAEAIRKLYPGVKFQIEGKGSSTAPLR